MAVATPQRMREPATFYSMTTDEHIVDMQHAPDGTMVQLAGGPPPRDATTAFTPAAADFAAEPAAAAEKSQPMDDSRDGLPEVAAAFAPQADSGSGDSYRTAPSVPEVSPSPALHAALLPREPDQHGTRSTRCASSMGW